MRGRRSRTTLAVPAALLAALALGATPAMATFPGANGKIAFESLATEFTEDMEVRSINPDGSGETRLDGSPRVDFGPRWSPDGSQIAFTSNRDGIQSVDVYVMNADGSGVRRLIIGAWSPAWSPDGSQIAFVRARGSSPDSAESDIYTMRVDGAGAPRRITDDDAAEHGMPAWSPDGRTIAFVRLAIPFEDGGTGEIWTIDASGRTRRAT